MKDNGQNLYVGIDIGGTKILAALVKGNGGVIASKRCPTPRSGTGRSIITAATTLAGGLLSGQKLSWRDVTAAGVAVPGVPHPSSGRVVFSPNTNLVGVEVVPLLEKSFGVPVAIGNDVNLGTMGEYWQGAGRGARSVVGMFVGTGIGGGIIIDGKLVTGCREAAAEVGHIIIQIGGPQCGCGNHGCLEALASRTAIERDIRQAVKLGAKTALTAIVGKKLAVIKSSALKQALRQNDKLVTSILRRASEVLGYACLTIRHLLDPEVIVIGGGVVEACGDFMMPVIERIAMHHSVQGIGHAGRIMRSKLGDDAVVLGAVALAIRKVRGDKDQRADSRAHEVALRPDGSVVVGGQAVTGDVFIRPNGKAKPRRKPTGKIGLKEAVKMTKGHPQAIVIAADKPGSIVFTDAARAILRERGVNVSVLPVARAVEAYNAETRRRALLIHRART